MLKFSEIKGEVEIDRFNCYRCAECGTITKTVDVDNGTTPFFHTCSNKECDAFGTSTFYKDILPDEKPTEEWYRPSLDETLQYLKEGKVGTVEHILMGGLNSRTLTMRG